MKKIFNIIFVGFIFFIIISATGCSGNDNSVNISESGTIETTDIVLSAQTSGKIKKLLFDEGDKISKGDTIVIIDHSLLDIRLQQAIAAEKAAEAQYNFLKNGARKEDLFVAKQNLIQAKTAFSLAKKNERRMEKLLESKSITQKQYEDVKANYDIATAKYKSAKETVIKLNRFARPEELQKAQANVEQATSQAALVKQQIEDSYIASPINGIFVEKYVELGELALPATSLVKVSDLLNVELYIYVSETDMGKIKTGDKVEVTVDSFPNKIFKGKVVFISSEAEFTPKNIQTKEERTKLVFKVKIKVPNPDFELKSGMPADAVIKLSN